MIRQTMVIEFNFVFICSTNVDAINTNMIFFLFQFHKSYQVITMDMAIESHTKQNVWTIDLDLTMMKLLAVNSKILNQKIKFTTEYIEPLVVTLH